MCDLVVIKGTFEGCKIRDIPRNEMDAIQLIIRQDKSKPPGIRSEVENGDGGTIVEQIPNRPGTYTPQGTRDQELFIAVWHGMGLSEW